MVSIQLGVSLAELSLLQPRRIDGPSFYQLCQDGRARRICFGSIHKGALHPGKGGHTYAFNIPFEETIGPLLKDALGLRLFSNKFYPGSVWRGFADAEEAAALREWLSTRGEYIYIRDLMDLSCALGSNNDGEDRTELGELEYRAKYRRDEAAIAELSVRLVSFVNAHSLFELADTICPVPPRPGKEFDLPSSLAARMAESLGVSLVKRAAWQNGKPELKQIPFEQKWDALESANLAFNADEVRGKRVILLDDLYQSGVTMNFVAGRLRAAGARRVFGLSVVKSMRNTDNAQ